MNDITLKHNWKDSDIKKLLEQLKGLILIYMQHYTPNTSLHRIKESITES